MIQKIRVTQIHLNPKINFEVVFDKKMSFSQYSSASSTYQSVEERTLCSMIACAGACLSIKYGKILPDIQVARVVQDATR